MDPSAKHFFARGETHHESKQMPGLTKLFIASKTSSHPHDCLTWFLHFGAESEETTEALTLREDFREWSMAGDDAEGTEVFSLFTLDQSWSSPAELSEFLPG